MANRKGSPKQEKGFDARLKYAKDAHRDSKGQERTTRQSGKELGFRIGTELIVAIVIGGAVGFGLDKWLGTAPWLLITCLFLGNAAGLWNIFRLANNDGYSMGFQKRK